MKWSQEFRLVSQRKGHFTFPQLVVLRSYFVITTVYPVLTSPGCEIKYVLINRMKVGQSHQDL